MVSPNTNSIINFEIMNEKFGKKEKLKSKTLITQLFSEGKSITKYPLKLIYLPVSRPGTTGFKTGVSVPKRNFKKAVERVHLKRLMREAFRKNKYLVDSNLPPPFAMMFIYIGKKKEDYQKLFSITEDLLKKFAEKELK